MHTVTYAGLYAYTIRTYISKRVGLQYAYVSVIHETMRVLNLTLFPQVSVVFSIG